VGTAITLNVKTLLRIFAGFIAVLVLLLIVLSVTILFQKKSVPDMTPEKVQQLLTRAGGIDEVNRETKVLFDKLGTNDWTFLYPEDLTNSPAIFFLYANLLSYSGTEYSGTRVANWPEDGRHLEIRFGNHWVGKKIYIFDSNGTNTFHPPPDWFQISSNIFVSR